MLLILAVNLNKLRVMKLKQLKEQLEKALIIIPKLVEVAIL